MQNITTLIFPKWIIPIEPANLTLENHAIAINENKIVAILPNEEAKKTYHAQEMIHLTDHVVMPGLINAHTHSPMVLFRGLADDLPLMDWLNNHIWPAERKWISEDFIVDGMQLAMLEMLRTGTTCFNENYFYSDLTAHTVQEVGMRAAIGALVIDFPTTYANKPEDYLRKAEEFCAKWRNNALIKPTIAPQGPYTVSDESFKQIRDLADKNQLLIHLHLHETNAEIDESIEKYGMRPMQRIYNLGLMSDRLQCIHMVHLNDEDFKLLQQTKAHIVHCPESNLKLASGFAPVAKMQKLGINVALGTDGAASNNDLDMFSEMRTASLLAKAVVSDATALNAYQTLSMATLNGAKALHLDHLIGSLTPGKIADLIAVDFSKINTTPVYHPTSHLVYSTHGSQVSDVWVAGKRLLANGEFTTLDREKILHKAHSWTKKIAAFS